MTWYDKAYLIALITSVVGMAVGVYLEIPKARRPQSSEEFWTDYRGKWKP